MGLLILSFLATRETTTTTTHMRIIPAPTTLPCKDSTRHAAMAEGCCCLVWQQQRVDEQPPANRLVFWGTENPICLSYTPRRGIGIEDEGVFLKEVNR